MLFRGANRGRGLRNGWGGQCLDRRRRGICGALNGMAINFISFPQFNFELLVNIIY